MFMDKIHLKLGIYFKQLGKYSQKSLFLPMGKMNISKKHHLARLGFVGTLFTHVDGGPGHRLDTGHWRNVWTGLPVGDRDQGLPMYWNLLDQSTSVHCAVSLALASTHIRHYTGTGSQQRNSQLCPVNMETGTQDNG